MPALMAVWIAMAGPFAAQRLGDLGAEIEVVLEMGGVRDVRDEVGRQKQERVGRIRALDHDLTVVRGSAPEVHGAKRHG